MKKLLYAIFSIAIFTTCVFNVQADEKCKTGCNNTPYENNCKAACDAQDFVNEKKNGCSGNQLCMDRWQNLLALKSEFFLQCYQENSNGGINYCKFDYDQCYNNCPKYGDSSDCRADCEAKNKIKNCILDAQSSEDTKECKDKYNYYFTYYDNQFSGNVTPNPGVTEKFDYETCRKQCTSSNMKECESDCYAQSKVEECKKDCSNGSCTMGCESGYDYYYNQRLNTYDPYSKVQCGDFEIPYAFPQIVRTIIVVLQIATPIIIILLGSIDLFKSVAAQKEDEIKKGQKTFLRRLLVGLLVFIAFFVVEFIIGLVAPKKDNYNMWNCVDCFVNGDCKTK